MPNRTKKEKSKFQFEEGLLDQLLEEYEGPDDMFGQSGLLESLKAKLVERALQGELTHHLGYEKHGTKPEGSRNARNGTSKKRVKTESSQIEIEVPRDREGSFEPTLVPKGVRRLEGFDNMVIALYSRGVSTRDIQSQLKEVYSIDASPDLISAITDEILEEVESWQSRPLDELFPIVFFDALVASVRDDSGRVVKKAVYIALGVNTDGQKEVLGMWIGSAEGAKFWLQILTELKNRGMKDMYIACVDGLKGFPEAIAAEYPDTKVQLCIVHMVRHSLRYVGWKERKQVAADLKLIYRSPTAAEGEKQLGIFREKWDNQFPSIGDSWERNWENLCTFYEFPEEIRKAIYTTNAVESLNHSLRKILKNKKALVSDNALKKLLYLGLKKASEKWTRPIQNWGGAMQRFAILYADRFPRDI
ncbi:MAG: IS256 family transposase [Verrucomicrobiales bacterium]|nr:IS256 family transposase [Verrucomicrobiales bacterium]MDF1756668.1 IS256 family transposase [Verrucomicrobiales bacterium]